MGPPQSQPALNTNQPPLVSVIVLNYNGAKWLERCVASLRAQTALDRLEVIIADNLSTDGSGALAARLVEGWPQARFMQHGANLGFCAGNNRAAERATGDYLFFLNNDTWLEADCLEKLVGQVRASGAAAACPLVLNYEDESFQSMGAFGFDLFGLTTDRRQCAELSEILMPEGCAYLIDRELFHELGGFDEVFFMYAEECDLSWRVWLAGRKAVAVPAARLHHRGAAQVNPQGGGKIEEFRTSDTKRFYANRNNLLVLLKNGRNLMLLLALLQLGLLLIEAFAGWVLLRRWSFARKAYFAALADCWRLRKHIAAERRRIQRFRKRSDFWMLRFLRLRLNRWDEVQRMRKHGLPKVTR